MNVTEAKARTKICPFRRISEGEETYGLAVIPRCCASDCMLWEFDEPMFDGPDSYVAEPGPTGHCGMVKQEVRT